jgi:hypothetical protein
MPICARSTLPHRRSRCREFGFLTVNASYSRLNCDGLSQPIWNAGGWRSRRRHQAARLEQAELLLVLQRRDVTARNCRWNADGAQSCDRREFIGADVMSGFRNA